ncbi:hypothetical protein BCF59_0548 [Mycoplasmopsis mustelae]|uniref:Uncharacterized protein n=1 Tax=Mycoplasmopsis mustelae TaxID=171289 RepID=A0A4R7UC94_9BACT|nr:hypothetical protein BCF59_0548 [Mycoplasmopsis mustelae]
MILNLLTIMEATKLKKTKNIPLISYLIISSNIALWLFSTILLFLFQSITYYYITLYMIVFLIESPTYIYMYWLFKGFHPQTKILNKYLERILKTLFFVIIIVVILLGIISVKNLIFVSIEGTYWFLAIIFFAWLLMTLIKVVLTSKTKKSHNSFINFIFYFNLF